MEGEGLVHFIMRIVKDWLWLSCQPWVLNYSLSLSCRHCHWTGCGDEPFHELICEFLCTLLCCTGGDRRGLFESGSLQPAWRKTKVVHWTVPVVLCTTCIMIDLHNVYVPLCQWIILQHSSVELCQEHSHDEMTSSHTLNCTSRQYILKCSQATLGMRL